MPSALNLDKAPGQITTYKNQAIKSHAMDAMKRELGASHDDEITRNLVIPSATSTTHSSQETVSSPATLLPVTVFPFFRLPPELRDEIYIYASLTENVWIGRPPRSSDGSDNAIVEKDSMHRPATLVRTEHSILGVCHQTRDEFRTAMWREFMTAPRVVNFRVYDFAFDPLEEVFANCSISEVEKLQVEDKCRVHPHLTTSFQWYRREKHIGNLIVLFSAWLRFNEDTLFDAEQSIDECDWYDTQLLRTTLMDKRKTGNEEWDSRWECPAMLEFWEIVSEAHARCAAARNARRNAFHKLPPLGR